MAPTAQCNMVCSGGTKEVYDCAFVNEEVDDGWYCSGKSECQNGVVREEGKPVQWVQHIYDRTAQHI